MSIPTFASMVSFSTGATCIAANWNTNYSYMVSALSDGTRDLTVGNLVATSVTAPITPNTILNAQTIAGSATISGELKGGRNSLMYSGFIPAAPSNNIYFGLGGVNSSNQEFAYKMDRAGSIVGYSISGTTTGFASNPTYHFIVNQNGSTVITTSSLTWTAINQVQSVTATLARGSIPFSAGDRLALRHVIDVTGNANVFVMAFVEVQFDT